jgi:hypothetical protein
MNSTQLATVTVESPLLNRTEPSTVRAQLDRLGASYRKAGATDYISFHEDGDRTVRLHRPPREHSGQTWVGLERRALELLAALPDEAGVQAVWRALSSIKSTFHDD